MAVQRLLLHPVGGRELPQIILTIGLALVIGDQILAH